MKKSLIYPIAFMIIITVFFTSILAFLNYSTADMIESNENKIKREKLLYVFNIPVNDYNPQTVKSLYDEYISETQIGNETLYVAKDEDKILGYAFLIDGNALWGSLRGFVALSSDFNTILGVDFLSHSETPGLGGRIDENWFKDQFRGINISNSTGYEYIIFNPSPDGNVDSISGATLTSEAVRKIINENLNELLERAKEESLNE